MLYVPSAASSGTPLPLFVMLHGCTQDPTDFADGCKMNTYGEQYDIFVVYPEQPTSANIDKCWNWFETQHQSRGSGEPELIVSIAQSVMAKYNVDNSSIFAGGISAGAAMADILGVTYPDFFRGVTVGSGLEYKAATSATGAYIAMDEGGPNPTTQGGVAYNAMGKYAQTLLVLVTHGTADYTVFPINGQQVTYSYAKNLDYVVGNGTSHGYITSTPTTTTPGQVPGGHAYTTYTFADSKTGVTYIKYITVNGMAHAWSGGSSSGTYTDPEGPDASLIMIEFFLGNNTNGTTSSSSSSSSGVSSSSASISTSGSVSTSTSGSVSTTGSTTGGYSITLTSIAGEDGFVGKTPEEGYSTAICKIGTAGMFSEDSYRTILSFDTSNLPVLANITSAVLTITQTNITGNLKPLVVDIKAGTFGLTTTLNEFAYYGIASAYDIGTIDIPSGDGQSSSFDLPDSVFQYIKSDDLRCQIMLRQNVIATVPTFDPDVLQIVDGGSTLTLTFQ